MDKKQLETKKGQEVKQEGEPKPSLQSEEQNVGNDGVTIPEAFQKSTHALMKSATHKHMLEHVHSVAHARRAELDDAEKPQKGKTPDEYSVNDMPA